MLALALIEQATIVIILRHVGLQRDRLVEVLQRLDQLAFLALDQAASQIGGRVTCVDRDRLVVVGEGEIKPAGMPVDQRAVGVGLGIIRIETDRLVEIGERLGVLSGLSKDRATHVKRLRILRISHHHIGQRRDIGRRTGEERLLGLACRRWRERPAGATGERRGGRHEEGAADRQSWPV